MNKRIQLGEGVESNNSKNSNKFDYFLKNTKKFIAFTLAETLIVMGIIGVVAALTIPNLNSSTNNMEKVTKVKKIYAELNEAHNRATAVYGPVETWFTNDPNDSSRRKRYFDRITEFMKVQKSCRDNNDNICYSENCIVRLDGDCDEGFYWPAFVLNSGASVSIGNIGYPKCNWAESLDIIKHGYAKNACGDIRIDIDGPNKGKFTDGIDVFFFWITKDGIFPEYTSKPNFDVEWKADNWEYGSTWILEKGNLDYLKVDSSGNCPDGTPLTWERGSCK